MLREFALWLDTHEWSTALHESLFAYPIIESTHVLTLCLFVGTLCIVDLRLLGVGFTNVPVSEVMRRMLPWTVVGFVVMFFTGLALFYAIPERSYHSLWFRIKVILLIIAGVNAWWMHKRVARDRAAWDEVVKPPRGARISAGISLFMWAGVIVTGRMIAYNWFDCDRQPQAAFVNWAAECSAMLAEAGG